MAPIRAPGRLARFIQGLGFHQIVLRARTPAQSAMRRFVSPVQRGLSPSIEHSFASGEHGRNRHWNVVFHGGTTPPDLA